MWASLPLNPHATKSPARSVSFDVSSTSLPLTTTHCTNTTTGYGFGDLPYYCTSTCADNVTSFVFKYATANKAGGFRLHVQSGEARGSKWWPESAGMYFESPVGSGEMWEYLETGGSFGVGYH